MASGWLARVARRFGELLGADAGQPEAPPARDAAERIDGEPEEGWARADGPVHPAVRLDDPAHLQPGIQLDENGRFVAGGCSYSTLAQAMSHLDRRTTGEAATRQAPPDWQAAARERPALSHADRPSAGSETRPTLHAHSAVAPSPPPRGRSWVRQRTRLVAGGLEFVTDLVPYGTPRGFEPRHDHSRIDPSLPVGSRGDPLGETLPYWPSYSRLDPRARRTYLEWLSRGRTDSAIPIGYVFLFFYGLEQRLLVEDARDEAGKLFAEVRRLLELHGANYSFQSYASRLLALAPIYEDEDCSPPTAACASTYDVELPLDVRLRLGQRLRDGQPFNADDALRWVLALPDVHLRTPGQRCFDELRALWGRRFAERHPDGLKVRTPKAIVRHEYRAASGTFSVKLGIDGLPDISGTSAPLGPLRAMLDACMEELSAYSRLLGRDPEARGRLRGDLLLPVEIRSGRTSLGACRATLGALCTSGTCPTVAEVARALEVELEAGDEKLGAAVVRQIGTALDALDHGFEPDRRYGSAAGLRGGSRVSIFVAEGGGPVDHDRAAYAAARGTVEVGVLAASADGEVAASELEAIDRRLRAMPDLAEGEIARLMAHARALAADPPKVRSALKKLGEVAPNRRSALAAAAIEAVLADGLVAPDEVRFLEALHTALGLPVAGLYSALHRGAEDEGPVPVVEAAAEATVALPSAGAGRSVPIDTARLERIRDETSRVSALLATIFTEDEVEAAPPEKPTRPTAATAFAGLDGPHSALLERLLPGPLARDAFDLLATELRLMPEGAIETINEWGFDRFDAPILEDDGDVGIAPEMREELQPMGVAA